jgi:hypothetical protein
MPDTRADSHNLPCPFMAEKVRQIFVLALDAVDFSYLGTANATIEDPDQNLSIIQVPGQSYLIHNQRRIWLHKNSGAHSPWHVHDLPL